MSLHDDTPGAAPGGSEVTLTKVFLESLARQLGYLFSKLDLWSAKAAFSLRCPVPLSFTSACGTHF